MGRGEQKCATEMKILSISDFFLSHNLPLVTDLQLDCQIKATLQYICILLLNYKHYFNFYLIFES